MSAPLAFIVEVLPEHKLVVVAFKLIVRGGNKVTVTVVSPKHVPSLPLIVYIVVAIGLAITFAPLVVFNPAAGDQV